MKGFTANLPTVPGTYHHLWDFKGKLEEHVLFVGFIDGARPLWHGTKKGASWQRLRCCKPTEYLHADRLTPEEWGGWWAKIEPDAVIEEGE